MFEFLGYFAQFLGTHLKSVNVIFSRLYSGGYKIFDVQYYEWIIMLLVGGWIFNVLTEILTE